MTGIDNYSPHEPQNRPTALFQGWTAHTSWNLARAPAGLPARSGGAELYENGHNQLILYVRHPTVSCSIRPFVLIRMRQFKQENTHEGQGPNWPKACPNRGWAHTETDGHHGRTDKQAKPEREREREKAAWVCDCAPEMRSLAVGRLWQRKVRSSIRSWGAWRPRRRSRGA